MANLENRSIQQFKLVETFSLNVHVLRLIEHCETNFWVVPCRHSEEGHFSKDANTLDSCKKKCRKAKACKGLNWLPEKAKCWLTDHPDKNTPIQVSVQAMAKVNK